MFCRSCGKEAPDGAKFCFHCGGELKASVAPMAAPVPTSVPAVEPAVEAEPTVVAEPAVEAEPTVVAEPVVVAAPAPQPIATPTTKPIATPTTKPVAARPKKKKKTPVAIRILLCFVSILLSVCLIVSLLLTMVSVDMMRVMNPDTLTETFESALQGQPTLTAQTLAKYATAESKNQESRDQFVSWIYDMLVETGGDEITFTEEQLDEFLERSTIEDFVIEKLVGYIMDYFYGTDETSVTATEVIELLEENEEIFEECFGITLSESVKEEVREFVLECDFDGVIHREAGGFKDVLNTTSKLASPLSLIILIFLDLFLMVMLLLANRFRFGAAMIYIGVSEILAGGLAALPTLLVQFIPSMLESVGIDILAGMLQVLISAVAPVHYILLVVGLIVLIAGIAVAIITCIVKKRNNTQIRNN